MANPTDQPPDGSGQPPRLRNRIRDAVWSVDMGVAVAFTSAIALVALRSGRSRPVQLGQRPRLDPQRARDVVESISEHSRPDSTPAMGLLVQCADMTWSHSGGRQGACSHHGGRATSGSRRP